MATQLFQPPHGSPSWFYACVEKAQEHPIMETVTLTPALASEMLKQNPGNRSMRPTKIQQYSSDMRNGRWAFNGEPIIVSKDGRLNDGQHRCSAVVESNTSIEVPIVFGIERETRITVDQGVARGAGDYLAMEGISYSASASTAARFILAYEASGGRHIGQRTSITNAQIVERVIADKALHDAVFFASHNISGYRHLFSSTIMTACFYILSRVHEKDAQHYLGQVALGENIKRGDPAFAVRQAFLTEKRERGAAMEIIFHGWNKFRRGERAKLVRLSQAQTFPELN